MPFPNVPRKFLGVPGTFVFLFLTCRFVRLFLSDSPHNANHSHTSFAPFVFSQDFDNTPNFKGLRKSWEPHVQDFKVGVDPTWAGSKGMGIIGAINYLSEEGMNAFSFIPVRAGATI